MRRKTPKLLVGLRQRQHANVVEPASDDLQPDGGPRSSNPQHRLAAG